MSTFDTRAARSGLAGHDADLASTVRKTSHMRQAFYVVVLAVALAGQVSGAYEALHIPIGWAVPAVGALELGGIVVLANADVRRRLGERAIGSRILSAAIAAGAVAFNWTAHANHLFGAFFAGMSAMGYLVWLTHTENQRRDRLRATGDLPPTTPAYELVGHWLRHPLLTIQARSLAKTDPALGLYGSLAAARQQSRTSRRNTAIAKVLHRKIRAAMDPATADIAIAAYDLDEIAERLAGQADYAGLTGLIAHDLHPTRLVNTDKDLIAQITQARTAQAEAEAAVNTEAARADAEAARADAEAGRRAKLETSMGRTIESALQALSQDRDDTEAAARADREAAQAAQAATAEAREDLDQALTELRAEQDRRARVEAEVLSVQELAEAEARRRAAADARSEDLAGRLTEQEHARQAADAETVRLAEALTVLTAEAEELRRRLADAETRPAETRPVRPVTKRQPSAAERIAQAVRRSPKASDATIAARLGLSEATVKRHRSRHAVDSVSTPSDAPAALHVA